MAGIAGSYCRKDDFWELNSGVEGNWPGEMRVALGVAWLVVAVGGVLVQYQPPSQFAGLLPHTVDDCFDVCRRCCCAVLLTLLFVCPA